MNDNEKYIDRKNALRYMGFRGEVPEAFLPVLDECEKTLCKEMTPRCVFVVREVSALSDLLIGDDVASHLDGCGKAVIFAATLGSKVDSFIGKYQAIDVTKALVFDAEASAAIEVFCDEMTEKIASSYESSLTSRFSPGYGDFPLEVQRELLRFVDAERKIGLYAGESYMLSPSKSVTAVIGISDNIKNKNNNTCFSCEMRDNCPYRREGEDCEL